VQIAPYTKPTEAPFRRERRLGVHEIELGTIPSACAEAHYGMKGVISTNGRRGAYEEPAGMRAEEVWRAGVCRRECDVPYRDAHKDLGCTIWSDGTEVGQDGGKAVCEESTLARTLVSSAWALEDLRD
jgi:hypothetical protein